MKKIACCLASISLITLFTFAASTNGGKQTSSKDNAYSQPSNYPIYPPI